MPNLKRKNTNFRRPVKRRKITVASLNRKLNKLAKDEELKFHDVNVIDAVVSSTGSYQGSLAIIAIGTGDSQRIGRKIRIKSIFAHITLVLSGINDQADRPVGDIVRIIVHVNKQTNGAQGSVTSLLVSSNYDAYRNLNNSNRYRVLLDRTYAINPRTDRTDGTLTDTSSTTVQYHKEAMTGLDLVIDYAADDGTLSTNTSNSLNVLFIARSSLTLLDVNFRIRYTG